jgi:arsenate reductase
MSEKTIIYHNPRCSKSREVLTILQENNCEIEIIEYLKTPPSILELKELLAKLNIKPQDLIRKNEEEYKSSFSEKSFTDEEWIEIMHKYPKLIERPIVVLGKKAVIGRPPVLVLDLI